MNLLKIAAAFFLTLSHAASPAPLRAQMVARDGQFAFIHAMTPAAGGAYKLTIDYAELLSGDAAERAAREDGQSSSANPNGIYIENRSKTLRTLTVPAWAQVYLLQGGQSTLVKPAVLYQLLQDGTSPFGAFDGFPFQCDEKNEKCLPVRVVRRGEQVVRVEQELLR